jgi:dTDP-4-amino-4,6-dideoxygalactose transaminase
MSRSAALPAADRPDERHPLGPDAVRRQVPMGPVVPHTRPSIGAEEEEAALRVLRAARLAPGAEAARLEGLVARLGGSADAVALSSGTLALTLALRALGLPAGGDVALPAYGCVALVHAVRAAGGRPLVCDTDPVTLVLDPEDLRRRATRMLAAIVVVHPFGEPADLAPFAAFGVPVVEDAAQAPGARRDRQPVGARGDAAVFSFGPTKLLTCGGPGGALASRDPGVVRRARDLARHDETDADPARVNGLMGDLHAAIAAVQIGRLTELVARRRAIAARYDEAFADLWPLRRRDPGAFPVHWRYLLATGGEAEAHAAALRACGVVARRPVWAPLHHLVSGSRPCPGADRAHDTLISLPLSPVFGETEIRKVIGTVRACLS